MVIDPKLSDDNLLNAIYKAAVEYSQHIKFSYTTKLKHLSLGQ